MNKLVIKGVRLSPSGERTRISFDLKIGEKESELWYELDREWEPYLTADRCDAAVVGVLLYALRYGYDIRLECPISEILYYHIQNHIIPQMCASDKKCRPISLTPTTLLPPYEDSAKAVGMGFSMGVDSFATLKEYTRMGMPESYRITHLTYHQVGAHHGYDGGKPGPNSPRVLFEGQLERICSFCTRYGFKLVVVNSNLAGFLFNNFERLSFHLSHTYRNASAVLILQKLFSRFYYASAYNLDEFSCNSGKDSAKYEKFLLPLLSTENTRLYSANRNWNRIKKVELLADYEPSYDNLTVCLTHVRNCGKCMKCRRTLLNLDVVGSLEKYAKSFDLEAYKNNDRESYLKQLWNRNHPDPLMKEILEYALNNNFERLPWPDLTPVESDPNAQVNRVNLRRFPSTNAHILKELIAGPVKILGRYHEWFAVETPEGDRGFCYADYVTPLPKPNPTEPEPSESNAPEPELTKNEAAEPTVTAT